MGAGPDFVVVAVVVVEDTGVPVGVVAKTGAEVVAAGVD